MSEEKALELGFTPKAYIRGWAYVASDPFEELLLGPTYATNKVLKQLNLTMADMGVIEFHEAFAGQVLANVAAMGSASFAEKSLGGQAHAVGQMDMSRVNPLGGSLALGHPFGATGTRLVTTAANRLQREGQRYALLTACADGGLATACVLENYSK
jgi:acetyl-CoA acyltransferase